MTKYRVKAGAHTINGVMRNVGDTFELANDAFINSPRRTMCFEVVAVEPVKEKKNRKSPEGGTGAPEGNPEGNPEGGTGGTGAPEGAPQGDGTGGAPAGGTGAPEGAPEGGNKKVDGRKRKVAK